MTHVLFLAVGAAWLSVPSAPVVDAAKCERMSADTETPILRGRYEFQTEAH